MRWLLAPLRRWRMRRLLGRWCAACRMGKEINAFDGDPCRVGWRISPCLRGRVLYAKGKVRERAMREAGL